MPHVSNDMIARRNFGTPEQQTTVAIKSVGGGFRQGMTMMFGFV
jgi:hypothetical protein